MGINVQVFAAMYTFCVCESAYGILSLHSTEEGAKRAVRNHKRRERKHGSPEDWERWTIQLMKVLP